MNLRSPLLVPTYCTNRLRHHRRQPRYFENIYLFRGSLRMIMIFFKFLCEKACSKSRGKKIFQLNPMGMKRLRDQGSAILGVREKSARLRQKSAASEAMEQDQGTAVRFDIVSLISFSLAQRAERCPKHNRSVEDDYFRVSAVKSRCRAHSLR